MKIKKTDSGLYLPDGSKADFPVGKVVAIGANVTTVQVGDIVALRIGHRADPVRLADVDYLQGHASFILGIFSGATKQKYEDMIERQFTEDTTQLILPMGTKGLA